MTGESIHALTNLSSGYAFELPVPTGQDAAGVAKAFLAEKDLPWDVQEGFFLSVYPTRVAENGAAEADTDSPLVANPPANLDSSPTGSPYDTQGTPGYDLESK